MNERAPIDDRDKTQPPKATRPVTPRQVPLSRREAELHGVFEHAQKSEEKVAAQVHEALKDLYDEPIARVEITKVKQDEEGRVIGATGKVFFSHRPSSKAEDFEVEL